MHNNDGLPVSLIAPKRTKMGGSCQRKAKSAGFTSRKFDNAADLGQETLAEQAVCVTLYNVAGKVKKYPYAWLKKMCTKSIDQTTLNLGANTNWESTCACV